MGIRNKTIRRMPGPTSRALARLINDQTNLNRRLKNLLPKVIDAEFAENAMLTKAKAQPRNEFTNEELDITNPETHMLTKMSQDIKF
jgi:hypothetical protein